MSFVFCLVLVADQLAKSMITARFSEGAFTSGNICGVRLRYVVNRRKPWGSTTAVRTMAMVWLLLSVAALIIASSIARPSTLIALGALLGGALGNLLDGFARNGVIDFIDLRVWPVFNIADAAIVAGAMLLLWNAIQLLPGR